jgi:hypothetical protein
MVIGATRSVTDRYSRLSTKEERVAYQYLVVPFIGQSTGSVSASEVAKQMERVIEDHASRGWEFYQLSDVNIEVRPGCLAGLLGAPVQYVRFDQLIFRADKSATILSVPAAGVSVSSGVGGPDRPPHGSSVPHPTSTQDPAQLVAALREQLRSPDWRVRERSASALGDLGTLAAIALQDLEMLRADPDQSVRSRAAWAVETIEKKVKRQRS